MDERSEKVEEAVTLYLLRQSNERKPAGESDGNDCWWPLDAERRECCQTHDERGVHVAGSVKAPTTGPSSLPADPAQRRRYLAISEYRANRYDGTAAASNMSHTSSTFQTMSARQHEQGPVSSRVVIPSSNGSTDRAQPSWGSAPARRSR